MNETIRFLLLLLGTLGAGLIAGLFFIFSNTIMKSFDRLPSTSAILAMQAINIVIINPLFMTVFFGTAAICLALLASALGWNMPGAFCILLGSLIYLIGSIGVTMICNVPLNNRMAALPETAPASAWADYSVPWTRWNHVRAIASLLTAALFVTALWQD
ncbi:MAG: hypothetical protein BGP04_12005 [Rhizobiales bacterium 62-17]|nr:DUF1772 domain-containing protein [Hyphomicrobiales bacterium]OJY02051.1 MAG: hypothetical protein BGP04_12005 [Rhizobiales bacterium 62-17]